jgi:hypothetical protein
VGNPTDITSGSPYLANPRGPSSQSELEIRWDYPVLAPKTADSPDVTVAVLASRALPFADAMARIAGDDRRPVLVLRECLTCTGTDDALMTRRADNEKTMLMSRWFHCVKLPADVLDPDHPFHALFEGEEPLHLFIANWDGSGRTDLNGQQSRSELWKIMEKKLAEEYASTHEPVMDEIFSILKSLDALDDNVKNLRQRLDDAIEEDGAKSTKAARLRREIDELLAERSDLRERAVRVSALKLKEADPARSEEPRRKA